MDADGERRWRGALAPFDGTTVFVSDDDITLADLRPLLIVIVNLLHAHFQNARLYRLKDWHEHDGFGVDAMPSSWEELRSLLVSDDALMKASTGDFAVRTAFFPVGYDFYLRIYVDDDALHAKRSDQQFYGDFDVTCQEPLVTQIKEMLERLGASVQTESAKSFFDRRYGG